MNSLNLYSDNVAPVLPEIMQALAEANVGTSQPYGNDPWSKATKDAFSDLFETEVSVFPQATGTSANALSLSLLTPPYGAVYCSQTAHIDTSECGAGEFFTGGAKIVPVTSASGRINPEALEATLKAAGKGLAHRSQPSGLSITQATERGSVYALSHVAKLTDIAKRHGLKIHLDGSRFANAVARLGCRPAEATWRLGVDVMSFGATKNGAMSVDAIVVFNPAMAEEMRYRARRAGQIFSKMRYGAVQLSAYIKDGLWLKAAGHANAMAERLGRGLAGIPGVSLDESVEINQVFVGLPESTIVGLEADGMTVNRRGDGHIRLVTAWNTKPEDVDWVVARVRAHAGERVAAD
jgi:threonine aldolase